MYQGKYRKRFRKRSRKTPILLVSLFLLIVLGVGGIIAFLSDKTELVTNQFTPSKITTEVEEVLSGNTKSDVKIKNTGNTTAWIRAAVVITWQDKDGNVYGQAPVVDTDYTIEYDLDNGWVQGTDGFYYWTRPVKSQKEDSDNCQTGILISSCTSTKDKAPEGYYLTVEIMGSGIQSKPASVFNTEWKSSGLKVNDGAADHMEWTLVKQGGAGN